MKPCRLLSNPGYSPTCLPLLLINFPINQMYLGFVMFFICVISLLIVFYCLYSVCFCLCCIYCFTSYPFACILLLFLSFLSCAFACEICKALLFAFGYEMCYINKFAFPRFAFMLYALPPFIFFAALRIIFEILGWRVLHFLFSKSWGE